MRGFTNSPWTGNWNAWIAHVVGVTACLKLTTDRALTEEQRQALWLIVDARFWFVQMVAKNYDEELAAIERQLEADLSP